MTQTVAEVVAAFPVLQELNPVPDRRGLLEIAILCGVLSDSDTARAIEMLCPGNRLAASGIDLAAKSRQLVQATKAAHPDRSGAELYSALAWTPDLERALAEFEARQNAASKFDVRKPSEN